ncbi:MAG: winged helix-turn-helix domain-containing protein, partial [Sphingomonadaceae bacterium]|nr:winged helix-turn-helix domain-containing protein [Sphingomonadaceae bacterium]
MIDLVRCPDFALGRIEVRPSSREVVGPDGTTMIEPKVMQVLVALAEAGGRVVSRDELVARCWGGRIVGDDAVNRVIGKVRRVAAASGDAFRVETVARTGYRLRQAEPGPAEPLPEPPPPPAAGPAARSRRARWLIPAL